MNYSGKKTPNNNNTSIKLKLGLSADYESFLGGLNYTKDDVNSRGCFLFCALEIYIKQDRTQEQNGREVFSRSTIFTYFLHSISS